MGPEIIGQHGREIDAITEMLTDVEARLLQRLEVKFNRETLDEIRMERVGSEIN